MLPPLPPRYDDADAASIGISHPQCLSLKALGEVACAAMRIFTPEVRPYASGSSCQAMSLHHSLRLSAQT